MGLVKSPDRNQARPRGNFPDVAMAIQTQRRVSRNYITLFGVLPMAGQTIDATIRAFSENQGESRRVFLMGLALGTGAALDFLKRLYMATLAILFQASMGLRQRTGHPDRWIVPSQWLI